MHKFNPEKAQKLDSEERHKLLNPEETLNKIGFEEGMLAAEIGCGTGFYTIPASRILGDDGKIYAFDIESKMLTLLRMKIEKPNIVPIVCEEDKLPLKDKLLDIALLAFMIHESSAPFDYIKEIKRVLKQLGRLAVIDWNKISEDEGPQESDRISKDQIIEWFNELKLNVVINEDLNASHYLLVAEVDH